MTGRAQFDFLAVNGSGGRGRGAAPDAPERWRDECVLPRSEVGTGNGTRVVVVASRHPRKGETNTPAASCIPVGCCLFSAR